MKTSRSHEKPASGDVLIAGGELFDPNFARSLVYLHDVDGEGASGLILNRPLGKMLSDIVEDPELPEFLKGLPLYFGGPVQVDQFLLVLFEQRAGGYGFECTMNPDPASIRACLEEGRGCLRAYIGYAGWTSGQLEEECRRGDWLTTGADMMMLTGDQTTSLWELYLRGDHRWEVLREYLPREWGRN